MKKLKKFIRLFLIIIMMLLASFGMSLTGAAPPLARQRETVVEDEAKKGQENPAEAIEEAERT